MLSNLYNLCKLNHLCFASDGVTLLVCIICNLASPVHIAYMQPMLCSSALPRLVASPTSVPVAIPAIRHKAGYPTPFSRPGFLGPNGTYTRSCIDNVFSMLPNAAPRSALSSFSQPATEAILSAAQKQLSPGAATLIMHCCVDHSVVTDHEVALNFRLCLVRTEVSPLSSCRFPALQPTLGCGWLRCCTRGCHRCCSGAGSC